MIKKIKTFFINNMISFLLYNFSGITVKAQTASMIYEDERDGGKRYLINLIDTPGHIDFSYEGKIRATFFLHWKFCSPLLSSHSFFLSSPLLFIIPSFLPFLPSFHPSFLPSFLPFFILFISLLSSFISSFLYSPLPSHFQPSSLFFRYPISLLFVHLFLSFLLLIICASISYISLIWFVWTIPLVARSLASCQGALLLVDSTQSVQAQTLANHAKAKTLGTYKNMWVST